MKLVTFKLVFRNWWRNKTFSVISIVSLAIGIACTNLLAAFVIYEFNIESANPNKKQIVYMAQDSPMTTGQRVSYIAGNIPVQLKEQYTEVEEYLRFNLISASSVSLDEKLYAPPLILTTDTGFLRFFPYSIRYGNLHEALSQPGKAALSEGYARKLFGTANPLGQTFTVHLQDDGMMMGDEEAAPASETYQVAAVLNEYPQSFLTFDILTGNGDTFFGGPTLLKVSPGFDPELFAEKLKQDNVPTLQNDKGRYYFFSLQDAYFQKYTQESLSYIKHGQQTLLYIGQISALLILLIACFNYINLNFSRVLQQVRTLHTQKLMGATPREVNRQLLADTCLTVGIAFLLSLLIAHDLLPVFNRIMSGRLSTAFFWNGQVWPVILLFILVLALLPALYMSRKITGLTESSYRLFFTGTRKRRIVTALSIAQYVISIGLVIATITVHSQLGLVRKSGERFRNLIEIGEMTETSHYIPPLYNELKKSTHLEEMTRALGSIPYGWLRQIVVQNPDGTESYYSGVQYRGEENLLKTLQLKISEGLEPHEALKRYPVPLYINQRYRDILIPAGEDPIGQPIGKYDDMFKKETEQTGTPSIICGIVEDFSTHSIEKPVYPTLIYLDNTRAGEASYLYIRLRENDKKQALADVKTAWEKVNPGKYFTYTDLYADFMKRNRKTTDMANLLLMYAVISLFLTCFGLFGMALYATRQRTKEIGIRKVNGATTLQIMLLLMRQFAVWIGIAFLIAAPLAWVLLNRWLESFANRVPLSPVFFLLGGLVVVAITLLTVSWHSYRAASGNPVDSLRNE